MPALFNLLFTPFIAILAFIFLAADARAEKRVALVIGNSSYTHVAALPNAANDSAAIALLLKNAGFDVVDVRRDASIVDIRRAVRDFSDEVRDADIAVIFYAGHGIEIDGTNYLIPTDARLASDFDVEDEAISLDRLLRTIEPAKRLRLVILDACRENPFVRTMKRTSASRSVGRGLAKVEPTTADTLIAYAAKAGSTAADGDGPNSPFTAALLKHLAVAGLDLRIAFGRVRDDVLRQTKRKQEPFVYGSLGGDIVSIVSGAPVSNEKRDAIAALPAQTPRSGQAEPAKPRVTTFDDFLGYSFQIDFWEHQTEIRPRRETWQVRRSFTVYAKSPDDIQFRITAIASDPKKTTANMRTASLDEKGDELQWTFANGRLKGAFRRIGWIYTTSVGLSGLSCDATIGYERLPGKTNFEMRRMSNKETMIVSSMKAERITCRVIRGDAIANPPTSER